MNPSSFLQFLFTMVVMFFPQATDTKNATDSHNKSPEGMWRAGSTPDPIYPMTQKFREAWKRWDSCFSYVTLPLSPSPQNISYLLTPGL